MQNLRPSTFLLGVFYPDHKAITGDPSDNIPGCPETGAKRASALINTYGGLESIPDEYLTIAFVADADYISDKLEAWRKGKRIYLQILY